ncbi:hypothetical protein ACYG9R_00130 [Mesorhizobium sp. RSR565B]|uniref:hypothetical protein n=1 Tax=unclassified Mesorhizobium TaxID=325217 RepID=UPI0003CF1A51|nr:MULTISPECIES: hypothetical protein [unclassified Mesorhizobium]ESY25665.1 hypothetical protein X750_01075 [Mesorhizobium sp. LNJC394B00]ESZ46658.1 hypothetical protein X730_20310 [Mesorhizobium sp. L103C565B0]ESZ76515.1 hypothetical protein X726_14820 [Mesorhizobium sp. L103C105A0]
MAYTASYLWFLGLCSVATGWLLISAIRLCRQVEDRSERLRNFSSEARLPRLVYVALNREVASDAGTQELRRGMNARLLGIAAILVILKLVDLVGWPSA